MPIRLVPNGFQKSASRILEVVRSHGAFLIEDDWAHDFGIDSSLRRRWWHPTTPGTSSI